MTGKVKHVFNYTLGSGWAKSALMVEAGGSRLVVARIVKRLTRLSGVVDDGVVQREAREELMRLGLLAAGVSERKVSDDPSPRFGFEPRKR